MAQLKPSYLGEDLEVVANYEDDTGTAIDPDDQDSDGTPDASVTIREEGADTPLVDSVAMTYDSTGTFTYIWDTSVDANGTGMYVIEVSAEFSGNTDIERVTKRLR